MILSVFGSSGLSQCLGDCTRAVISCLLCVAAHARTLCLAQVVMHFSAVGCCCVPLPYVFHGISIFAASLAQEHQDPAWWFSCSACCGWVVFSGLRHGPDLAHMDMNKDTRTHTRVHTHANMDRMRLTHSLLPQPPFRRIQLCGSSRKDIGSFLGGAGEGMADVLQPLPHWCHGEMQD